MSDFIGIDIHGLPHLQNLLKAVPPAVQDAITDDLSTYTINVLRAYPPHRYVTRQAAYGRTFQSDKQRRWFFAALKDGRLKIPYPRTQTLSRGWHQVGRGAQSIIANETPYAGLVMGDGEQSRHAALVGWNTTASILKERERRMDDLAQASAKKGIRKAGFK
jgi:hypothetical protein